MAGMAGEPNEPLTGYTPSPEPELQPRRSGRKRQFPLIWRDFEATSYSPVTVVLQANEQVFEQRVEAPQPQEELALLTAPDMTQPSQSRSPLDGFRICRAFSSPITLSLTSMPGEHNQAALSTSPPDHPFGSDSAYELIRASILGPSSKTVAGMDGIANLIRSGKVTPEGLANFKAATEIHRLDTFATTSPIAGGPWKVGSVKIRMPCMRSHNPGFSTEKEAPEFEVHGIRYRSLVDIVVSKISDPTASGSFVYQPFTECWCPPGASRPIRVYGEAYSSNIAIQLMEEIRGIPPPPDNPHIEDAIVLLMLGSDATHLANFGTASLWPIYLFFGNMSKYDSSKPSEFPACHLAYLPSVGAATTVYPHSSPLTMAPQLPDSFADEYMKVFGIVPPP